MTDEHQFASARLRRYLDRELPDAEDRRVCVHLRACEACCASLGELTALSAQLRAIAGDAPDGLADRVIARLDAENAATRLSVVAVDGDRAHPGPTPPGLAGWGFARRHLRQTLLLSFVVGVAITLLKDLGPLLQDGLTTQNCVVCGANFVAAFALLNVWLLLARPRTTYWR